MGYIVGVLIILYYVHVRIHASLQYVNPVNCSIVFKETFGSSLCEFLSFGVIRYAVEIATISKI